MRRRDFIAGASPHGPCSAFMDIFTDPPLMKHGYITVPDGPGPGVTIRPDLIA